MKLFWKYVVFIFLVGIIVQSSKADDIYLKDRTVIKNCQVKDTIANQVRVVTSYGERFFLLILIAKIDFLPFDSSQNTRLINLDDQLLQENNNSFDIQVMTVQGDVFWCSFVESTDSTVTYAIKEGNITLRKIDILSAVKKTTSLTKGLNAPRKTSTNKMEIKEYEALPLLIFAIGGGVWSYTLFKKSSELRDASNIFELLKLTALQNEAQKQSGEKQLLGIVAGIVSAVLFFVAINPTTRTIEQPVTIFPTNNGLSLCIRF